MQAQASLELDPRARPPREATPEEVAARPPDKVCEECGGPSKAVFFYDALQKRWRYLEPCRICRKCSDGRETSERQGKQRAALHGLWKRAGFPEDLRGWDFDQLWDAAQAWKTGDDLAGWQRSWQAVKTWPGYKGALVLRGTVGTGKSALAAAAAKALARERGLQPLYLPVPALDWNLSLKGKHPDKDAARELLTAGLEAGLAVLDDLAVARLTSACQRGVGLIIDLAQAKGKPVIITTNASAAEVTKRLERAGRGGRIGDRLYGYSTEVVVGGESFRKIKREKGLVG